ncbi:MAG: hypothetical protein C5B57_05625 [Blastocatellia bacterium]|nr:MAG: hypothetical protein C5B57_05625 [Blastocatellia bacterium]
MPRRGRVAAPLSILWDSDALVYMRYTALVSATGVVGTVIVAISLGTQIVEVFLFGWRQDMRSAAGS